MYTGFYHTHKLVVVVFLLIYLIKTILLLTNKTDALTKFTQKAKIPEMIVSFLFLGTGIFLLVNAAQVTTLQIIKLVLVFASIPLAVVGFKKHKKPLAVLSLLFIIGAYGLAEVNKARQSKRKAISEEVVIDPSLPGYNQIAHGQALYQSQCIACHGEQGDKGLAGAKNLKVTALTKEETIAVITNGKNTMPGYGKTYAPKEIEAIAAYALSLKTQ